MKKTRPTKKKISKRFLTIAGVLTGLLIILFVRAEILKVFDHRRFNEADANVTMVANAIESYLGSNVKLVRNQKECFNTGQGPYDNGYLVCQTTTVIQLERDVDTRGLVDEFRQSGTRLGQEYASHDGIFPYYRYVNGNGLACDLEIRDAKGMDFGNLMRTPFRSDERPAIAVGCSDRARAKYYPYVD